MKSLIVTLLSGFMIYAGYIYHPIIHRIGNDLGQRFQTEFVPVEQKNAPLAQSAKTKAEQSPTDNSSTQKTDATDAESTEMNTNSQTSSDTKHDELKTVHNSDISPRHRRVRPVSTGGTHKRNTQTQKPPRFDLLTAIKKGVKVSDPSQYFISDRDKELGREIQKLENDFEQQYANQHLTMSEIKQLKEDYQRAFNDLAEKYNISSTQLAKFREIIKHHNY